MRYRQTKTSVLRYSQCCLYMLVFKADYLGWNKLAIKGLFSKKNKEKQNKTKI